MSEDILDSRWEEIAKWAEDEWQGGDNGWVTPDRSEIRVYAGLGMMLKFSAYMDKGKEYRTLYRIELEARHLFRTKGMGSFGYIFSGNEDPPSTLEELLELYIQKYAKYPRQMRRAVNTVKRGNGYQELSEAYVHVLEYLRAPYEHHELYHDIEGGEYEEGISDIGYLIREDLSSLGL